MEKISWCAQAKDTVEKLKRMEEDGDKLDFDLAMKCMLADYMCERNLDESKWKTYNEKTRGAIYPEDMKTHLDEKCAKNWVSKMHHKLNSGTSVSGEHWDMAATTKVGEDAGIDFSEVTPIEWYVTLNMMWHDHYRSAVAADMLEEPTFYIELAKDFLFDDDGKSPHEKLMYYYNYMK